MYFASIAYAVMHALRRVALQGTEMDHAQCGTIRLRLLKIGAWVRVTTRRKWLSPSQAFPLQELFARVMGRLRAGPAPTN